MQNLIVGICIVLGLFVGMSVQAQSENWVQTDLGEGDIFCFSKVLVRFKSIVLFPPACSVCLRVTLWAFGLFRPISRLS